jgi:hypothetical protein
MSTLKDAILQRRMVESDSGNPCFSTGKEVSTFLVEASNGESWLLPWHHFLHGCRQTVDSNERLVLTFATQEVVLQGVNLSFLVDEIAHLRLDGVRPAPGQYQKSAGIEPFVEHIAVQPAGDHCRVRKPLDRESPH